MPLRFSLRSKASGPSSTGAVQVWVGARPGPWQRLGRLLLVSAGLGGGLLLLGLSFRLGLRLMLNPEALPQGLAQWWRSQPLTLAPAASLEDLRRQAEAAQQRLGDPLGLGDGFVLVPVLEAEAETLVSLALFQGQGGEGELSAIATLAIEPLPKDTVLAPFRNGSQTPTAVPSSFPLRQVVPLPPPPGASEGIWLTLEGTWQQQGLTLRYGHLLHVDLQTQENSQNQGDSQNQALTLLEPWSSPANRPPQWADLDGDGPSDLIIDETVGLEPTLRGWQVMAGARPRLQPVSWLRVPVDAGAKASTYQQALRLARGGLWHQAQAHLADLKPALDQGWNPAAEAQLRLMERHAVITQRQAEQDWSTPTQYILALLIDGRWETALAQLEKSPSLVPAVLGRLGADRGQMWNRISAAAALPDPPPAVYVWGGLAIKAQQNQSNNLGGASPDWLDRQPVPALARQRLATVLAALTTNQQTLASARNSAGGGAEAIATPANNLEANQPFGAIVIAPAEAFIGQGNPIAAPPAGYAAPGQSFDAGLGQWYAVELRAVRQDQGWRRGSLALPPGANPVAAWSVVQPAAQATPQILRWVSPTTGLTAPLTVRGLRLANGTPTLLATGPAVMPSSPPPLVFTQGALMWLDANQGQRPDAGAIAAAATAIFGGQTPPPGWATTLATQHRLDLTGDGQAERVLTWNEAALDQLKDWQVPVETTAPKTMVLDQDNRVLYSDLFTPQTLVALTSPATGWPVGLVVYRSGGYDLLSWLTAAQRFE